MKYHVLYNPLSGNKTGEAKARTISRELTGDFEFEDMLRIKNVYKYLQSIPADEAIVVAGGDGTLNHLVNDIAGRELNHSILFYPAGSGNDFAKDAKVEECGRIIVLDDYINSLPTITINGKTQYFLNGIGYGIDGYVCEVGDRVRATSDKPINYSSIALKSLLFYYKPTNAKITVDGVTREYQKVWLAPTMNGRYFGGGMMITPDQDRLNSERTVSSVVWHGTGKLATLLAFPHIFKGTHTTNKHCEIFEGRHVIVEFDRPTALQIDGETILDVSKYEVRTASCPE